MLFKMFYYKDTKRGKKTSSISFDGQFVHERIFYFYFSTGENGEGGSKKSDKNCPPRFEEFEEIKL